MIGRWRGELDREVKGKPDVILRRRIESYLDQGYGSCYLRDKRVAKMMEETLFYHADERYRLTAWVVMPNHDIHF